MSSAATLRPQYHFRQSANGLMAWDVRRLIELSTNLPTRMLAIADVAELDENHWYQFDLPTCRSIVLHAELMDAADLRYPIILDASGRVMDGMHRICKALRDGVETVACVQFGEDPEPDYVGRDPSSLPYSPYQADDK